MPVTIGHMMKPTRTALGAFVRQRRLRLGLTQAQLASRMKAFPTEICVVERGQRSSISPHRQKAWARALQCSLPELAKIARLSPPHQPTELGSRLLGYRTECGWTQKRLAAKLGISVGMISDLERGRRTTVRPVLARRLAPLLHIAESSITAKAVSQLGKGMRTTASQLGLMIRQRRLEFDLTQRALAKMIGITHQYLSMIEMGRATICQSPIRQKLAMALHLRPTALPLSPRHLARKLRPTAFAQRLTDRRIARHLTQPALSTLVGLTVSEINQLETGKRISQEAVKKLCSFLDCPVPRSFRS